MMKKELIRQARQADLAGYLLSVGVPLVRVGSRHRHAEHDSLTFTENAYYWNSQQESGNAIDYLTRHMGMNFTQAVSVLIQVAPHQREPTPTAETKITALSIKNDSVKVKAYLHDTRYIGHSIIDYLVENRLLFQERKTNNAIFPMYDENGEFVGAELQGILPNKRFKGVTEGHKPGYGFNVRFASNSAFDYALFFESAVDLISFVDWKFNKEQKSLDGCILVSMAGLKPNILKHTLKAFGDNLKAVVCVDNDSAGQNFKNKLRVPFIDHAPHERFKDWNDQLTAWRNAKPISRLLDR